MTMEQVLHEERRDFLKKVSITGGGLLLGFTLFEDATAGPVNGQVIDGVMHRFNSYLSIAADGVVTIASPNPELGQNIKTSFPMIVADELRWQWRCSTFLEKTAHRRCNSTTNVDCCCCSSVECACC